MISSFQISKRSYKKTEIPGHIGPKARDSAREVTKFGAMASVQLSFGSF